MAKTHPLTASPEALRICVVGSGTRFLSGISYYTNRLVDALAPRHDVSAILMRRLLPRWLYPGRQRVGAALSQLRYPAGTPVFDGIDWYWIPSLLRALRFLRAQSPQVVVLQWWSGTVLHSHLVLAVAARMLGARVVIEFHELLDTGEARLALAGAYARAVGAAVVGLAQGYVVHSEFDRAELASTYATRDKPVEVIALGPFDHHRAETPGEVTRTAPADACNLLFFGTIRPYKGLEDLITAFDSIAPDDIGRYWLTVVGETWEGWTAPSRMIAASRHRDQITFVNRYVDDAEVSAVFAGADVVVLPYHRSSASGPLHIAMSHGLPTVVTQVGGLTDAASGYEGAVLVPPRRPDVLVKALATAAELRGQRFADRHSWETTVGGFENLFARMGIPGQVAA